MNISAWDCYRYYIAMKMHFTTTYDIFKYKGKTRVTKDAFLRRQNLVFMFQKLGKKFNNEEIVNYFLANFVNDKNWSLGSLNAEESHDVYFAWVKRNGALTYSYKQDLAYLLGIHNLEEFDKQLLTCATKNDMISHPPVLREYLAKKISIETMIILDKLYNYAETFDVILKDDIMWQEVSILIKKYTPFIKIKKEHFNDHLVTS